MIRKLWLFVICLSVATLALAQSLAYQKWLDEDVAYIITPQERAEYLSLKSDDARDEFVRQFWTRRDPTPPTVENEYKEEHYRRIAYSNQHFAERVAGWKTDRGRTYIMFGPPDDVHQSPASGPANTHPATVTWRYKTGPSKVQEQMFLFVDECKCGEYRQLAPAKQ
jgi:GWxTD domain-containing protein